MKNLTQFHIFLLTLCSLGILAVGCSSSPPSNSATLKWEPSSSKTVVGYKIYYGTTSGKYTEMEDVGLTTTPQKPTYVIKNLNPQTTYYFSVRAYDKAGKESEYAKEVSKSIPAKRGILQTILSAFK